MTEKLQTAGVSSGLSLFVAKPANTSPNSVNHHIHQSFAWRSCTGAVCAQPDVRG